MVEWEHTDQNLNKNTKYESMPAKVDLDKKSFPKQKIVQNFIIDVQGFRKKMKILPQWEMGVTS